MRGTDQLPRLPIDRVFTVKGFGTVVTGTLTAGALAVDDRVEVYPRSTEAKIRGLQAHGHAVASAQEGADLFDRNSIALLSGWYRTGSGPTEPSGK